MSKKTLHNDPTQSGEGAPDSGESGNMPKLPTGLVKEAKSGVYHLRRRIPADLVASYGGKKKEIVFSLRTSDYRTAVQRHRKEEAKLTTEWEIKRENRARHFVKSQFEAATIINELTDADIEKICLHFRSASLHGDEMRRDDGNYAIDEILEYQSGYAEANAILKAAVAVGDYELLRPMLEQFLALYRYELNIPESDSRRLALAFARSAIQTNESLLQRYDGKDIPTPRVLVAQEETGGPTFSDVVKDYMVRYEKLDKTAMLKKVRTVLPLMLEVIGHKSIKSIRQSDIVGFFDVVQALPPRWKDVCRQKKIGAKEVAKLNLGEMSKNTFDGTYLAAVNPFLEYCKTYWQDRGWPTTLTTAAIRYTGSRVDPEGQQRSFRTDELKRLFGGPEMLRLASSTADAHMYWLPIVGLFTGARINEICQINPQVDIRKDGNGVWFFDITEKSDADERVVKSVKTAPSKRKVPIHSQLIKLGFLDYVEYIKKKRSKLLLPEFPPSVGRASPKAGEWFIDFIKELGLRDDTPGARLVGMHAFRSTFLNKAQELGVVNAEVITGHASNITEIVQLSGGQVDKADSQVVRNYKGELPLSNKVDILEKISFDGVVFCKPKIPQSGEFQ